jgi:tRNA(Ile)-lysidine synthase
VFERVRVRRALGEGAGAPEVLRRSGGSLVDRSAADFLAGHARIHSGLVAELDWSGFDAGNYGHRLALFALAAMMGGRSHLAGRDQRRDMLAALGDADFRRGSAGRVIFERRGSRLFIGREDRDIPEMEIAPGQAVEWDGRFEIRNKAGATIRVGKGGFPLVGVPLPPTLPALVGKRATASQPSLKSGDPGDVEITPMIAFAHRFLTADRLELANKLAFLGGLNQFPMMPFA